MARYMHKVCQDVLGEGVADFFLKDTFGVPFYTYGFCYSEVEGVTAYLNDEGHVMLRMSGTGATALSALGLTFNPDQTVWKCTRFDIAHDVPIALDFPAVHDWVVRNSGMKRSVRLVLGRAFTGASLYVGSRSSEKMLRLYDKQAESQSNAPMTRVELEVKGKLADTMYWKAAAHAGYLLSAYDDMIGYNAGGFAAILRDQLGGDAYDIPVLGRKKTNTVAWLEGQVLSAFIKLCRSSHKDAYEVLSCFIEAYDHRVGDEHFAPEALARLISEGYTNMERNSKSGSSAIKKD
jgi:hypothetical protein